MVDIGLNIFKKIICISIALLLIISSSCVRGNNSIRKVGNKREAFDRAKQKWEKNSDYEKIHNIKLNRYLLFIIGSWTSSPFTYFLLNMETNILESNALPQKIVLQKDETDEFRRLFQNIDTKNNIYDGVPYLLGETVYVVNYIDGNKRIEFGTFTLSFRENDYIKQNIPTEIKEICRKNTAIIHEVYDLFGNKLPDELIE